MAKSKDKSIHIKANDLYIKEQIEQFRQIWEDLPDIDTMSLSDWDKPFEEPWLKNKKDKEASKESE